MTFLAILAALFVDRALPAYRPRRTYRWFDAYCGALSGSRGIQWLMSRPWGVLVPLLPLVLLVVWLQSLASDLGAIAEWLLGAAVLLYCLGPRDLGDEVERFLQARDAGDDTLANKLAQQICLGQAAPLEPRRSIAVARAAVVLANRRFVGPIFWFVVFGATGAAAYRLILAMAEHLQRSACPAAMQRYSDEMRYIADWAPARLTAAGYAIAGNFGAVLEVWREFEYRPSDSPLTEADHLLARTGLAALDTFPSDAVDLIDNDLLEDARLNAPVVEDAMALVWRTLAIWVTLVGAGSLIAALA